METEKFTPIPFAKSKIIPLTIGERPAEIIIGTIIVPTSITIPKPLLAAKITEQTAKNDNAIGSALSPAISAAFFMIVSVTPTLDNTFPNRDPKISPEIAVDILIDPASKTSLTIVNCSGLFDIIVIPAIKEIAIAIIGNANIVGIL